ncbi:MAG: glycosyltransferase [Gemmatimonadales bacterium]
MTAPRRAPTPVQPSDYPERPLEQQRAFFDDAMARCLDAEARTGIERRHFDVAGTRVELVFAGDRFLHGLTGALAHLAGPPDRAPDVTIHVWDSLSSGIAMVPAPCPPECFTDRGELWGMMHPRVRSAYHHWFEYSLNLLDLDRRLGVYWVGAPDQLPYWTEAAPFRTLLHWWLEDQGAQVMHAASIGTDAGALLITGKGGVGKSTTALACLSNGMAWIGDDYLAVRLDPEPRVYSLYSTAKLDARQLERFPRVRDDVVYAGLGTEEKAVIQLMPRHASQLRRSLPLRAIATPSFSRTARTVIRPGALAELQRAAEFTTMSQLPHAGRITHDFIERLVREVPRLHLALGHDIATVPETVRGIVELEPSALTSLAAAPEVADASPSRPLVTVVIPMFNGARFLPAAIRNALRQGYAALDLVVVDDGSLEDIPAAIGALPVEVRYFRQLNAGPAAARNRGIQVAAGDFIAFLDVDDLWPAETLGRLVEILTADPDIDVVRGLVQLTRLDDLDEPGEFIGNPAESFPYSIGAGVYRRRAFERAGLFDAALRFGEDQDWYLRAANRGVRIRQIDTVVMYARRHDDNMTRDRSAAELNPVRLLKNALDRRRAAAARPPDQAPGSSVDQQS